MNINYMSNIWKVYLFRFLSSIEVTASIYALFLMANGLSMTQIMFLEIIYLLLVIILEVPSGAFADIYGRKLSMALGMLFYTLSFIVFGFSDSLFHFIIANLLFSIGNALYSGADSALIYDSLKEHSREKEYSKVLGYFYSIGLFVLGLASLLGGYLAFKIGFRYMFFLTAGSFFLGFVTILFLKEPPIHKQLVESNYINHLKSAFRYVIKNKALFNLIIYYGVFGSMSYVSWLIIQPYYSVSEQPGVLLGVAMFFYFSMAALGSILAHKTFNKMSRQNKLLFVLLIAALSFITMFFVDLVTAIIFIVIMSLASGLREVYVNDETNKLSHSHHRATILSIMNVSRSIIYILLAPILGLAVDIFSPRTAFLIMGLVLLVFFVIMLIFMKDSKGKVL